MDETKVRVVTNGMDYAVDFISRVNDLLKDRIPASIVDTMDFTPDPHFIPSNVTYVGGFSPSN